MYKHFIKKIKLQIEQKLQNQNLKNNMPLINSCFFHAMTETNKFVKNWLIMEDIDLGGETIIKPDLTSGKTQDIQELINNINNIKNELKNSSSKLSKIKQEFIDRVIDEVANIILQKYNENNKISNNSQLLFGFNQKLKHPFLTMLENIAIRNHNPQTYSILLNNAIQKTNNFYEACTIVLDEAKQVKASNLYVESSVKSYHLTKRTVESNYITSEFFEKIKNSLLDKISDTNKRKEIETFINNKVKNLISDILPEGSPKPVDLHREFVALLRKGITQPLIGRALYHIGNNAKFPTAFANDIYNATKGNPALSKDEINRLINFIDNFTKES
jgi:hypothetical protein